jgi:hypothetical protein
MVVWKSTLLKVAALITAAAVGTGAGFLVADPAISISDVSRAWIDDPLDGEVVAPGPVAVIAHAYHLDGVAEMTLLVDGEVVATTIPQNAGETLTFVEWSWVPGGVGVYVLEVVGLSSAGEQGLRGRAVVEVIEDLLPPDPGVPDEVETTTTTVADSTTTSVATTSSTTTTTPGVSTTTTAGAASTTTSTTTPATTTTTAPTTTTTPPPPCDPPPPILLSPANGSSFVGPNPAISLDWTGWRGTQPSCVPSGFYVEVAYDSGFLQPAGAAHLPGSVTAWSTSPSIWSCNLTHHWRVWSKRSDGTLAASSAIWTIDVVCVS